MKYPESRPLGRRLFLYLCVLARSERHAPGVQAKQDQVWSTEYEDQGFQGPARGRAYLIGRAYESCNAHKDAWGPILKEE